MESLVIQTPESVNNQFLLKGQEDQGFIMRMHCFKIVKEKALLLSNSLEDIFILRPIFLCNIQNQALLVGFVMGLYFIILGANKVK